MIYPLEKLKAAAALFALLSSTSLASDYNMTPKTFQPNSTQGFAVGVGAGVKLLNLKNVSTCSTLFGGTRTHDGFANASSPVLGVYLRQYTPTLLPLPTFLGVELNYYTGLDKTDIYGILNAAGPASGNDTGYRYRERWDAKAMLGAQLYQWSQLDLWVQAGLQLTYFEYEGITRKNTFGTFRIKMDNNLALAPAGGLELRYSQAGLMGSKTVTDFIVGWTASYRSAFSVAGTAPSVTETYTMAMSSNWSHTFGLKVMYRF